MSKRAPGLKLCLVIATGACLVLICGRASARRDQAAGRAPNAATLFSPSNARTEDGGLIPSDQFFPASRCASCHRDTHEAWAESLHRNAGREPFYKASVEILERTRTSAHAQHCESCHAPVAVFSGALLEGSKESRAMDDEGVTCTVCHSITEARLDGTGSYTIRRPALLAREDGTPVLGDVPDEDILADVAAHRRAVMRPLLKTPEFCAVCHKSAVPPELNGYKFLRGFSAYDEWQQSAASRETVTPYYRREHRADCRSCHMPEVASRNDAAAEGGLIASHRWLGANTTTPLFYRQTRQVELTEQFLRENVLSVDIFCLKSEATGKAFAPLAPAADNRVTLRPGEEVTVDVVVFNRRAAHSFPPELRDMYEPWVEFEAVDASGKTIFHSGFVKPDGTLDESAHVYKAILLDEAARPITRHQVWLARVKAYDNSIPPGRADLARYRFRVPAGAGGGAAALTLRARVNYRRFIQEYTDHVLRKFGGAGLKVPVVRMAEATVRIVPEGAAGGARRAGKSNGEPLTTQQQSRRWNDYGISLLEQAQYGPAAEAFRRAGEFDPSNPDLLVNAAIAEWRTERFGPEREQLRKAALLLERALGMAPALARARFYRAVVMRAEGRGAEAAEALSKLAAEYPRDREVRWQLGQTLYALGRIAEAGSAFEAMTGIDPNDHRAYQFLTSIYMSEGRRAEAERTQALYLLWRDDPLTDVLAGRFFSAQPGWAEERVWAHAHGENSMHRPTAVGRLAAPDR